MKFGISHWQIMIINKYICKRILYTRIHIKRKRLVIFSKTKIQQKYIKLLGVIIEKKKNYMTSNNVHKLKLLNVSR